MSETPSPPGETTSDTSRLNPTRLLTAAGFVGLIAVVLILAWKLNNAAPAIQNQNVELNKQLLDVRETLNDLRKAELLRHEEEQVRRSDQQQAAAAVEEAGRAIDDFQNAVNAWQRATTELFTTSKGKAVAANPEAVKKFHALRSQHRPDAASPELLRKRLETLREPLTKAIATNNVSYAPSEDLMTRIAAVHAEASSGEEVYSAHNRNLASVVASVPEVTGEGPDLQTALEKFEEQLSAEEVQTVAAAIEKERKDRAEKLAAAKAETERELTAAQLKNEETQRAIKLREAADNELAAKAKAAEDQKLRAAALKEAELERKFQAALPEIKSLLKPFISDGYNQLKNGSYLKSLNKGPVSYSALKGAGHLDPTLEGVRQLRNAMFLDNQNDRELGSFPGYYTQEWHQPTKRAQELLIEFGPLMVEKKMLTP